MKLSRLMLGCALLGGLALAGVFGQSTETSGIKMTNAASQFLDSLTPEQKQKATFGFDDAERTNWNFVPLQDSDRKPTRKGLRLEEMTPQQRAAALALVKAGTSNDGYVKAVSIMGLEAILKEVEKTPNLVRNSDWYFFSIFGSPSKTSKWGWRVEGHHLSLNFTIDNGKVVGATPAFFGANPAVIRDGDRKGRAILPEAEQDARDLARSLSDEQRKAAYHEKPFEEIEQKKAAPTVGAPQGLPAAQLSEKQKDILTRLLENYANRLKPDIAEVLLQEVRDAGIDKIHFAYSGSVEEGKLSSYRVHGPTVLIEFLNVQADGSGNPTNHFHTSWRGAKGDFGQATK
jgi:hypothetical protein